MRKLYECRYIGLYHLRDTLWVLVFKPDKIKNRGIVDQDVNAAQFLIGLCGYLFGCACQRKICNNRFGAAAFIFDFIRLGCFLCVFDDLF